MKCQNCKENEANVSYTQIINGEKMQLILCDKCANEMNIGMNFKFGFNDVFSTFFDEPSIIKTLEKPEVLKCDACNMTYDEFANTGMFGCENCYRVFSNRLDGVLNKLHGNNRHVGKTLGQSINNVVKKVKKTKDSELEELKNELNECIKNEEYEKAAIIRDKIKKVEAKQNERGRGE